MKLGRNVALVGLQVAGATAPAFAKIHPELSGQTTVDDAGRISSPLAGSVDTTDRDPSHTAQGVRCRLAPFVRKVAVDVQSVTQAQSIFLAGGFGGIVATVSAVPAQRATYDLDHGRIDMRQISVLRDGAFMVPFDASSGALGSGGDLPSQSGDISQLRSEPVALTVRGEGKRPGVAYRDPTDAMSAAITQVGGELPTSATNNLASREIPKRVNR